MSVLILGAQGNLGSQLVKIFGETEEVIAWDKGEIDITDRELIIKKISELKPALIINAAAFNSVDKCEEDAGYEIAKRVNIDGPKFLAEAALQIEAVFVHYSSDYVFDGRKKIGYKESDKPNPINRYGKTKFHGEKKVLEFSGRGLKWYLIRTSKLFGPKGESAEAKPSFFEIMRKTSEKQDQLEVVNEEMSCFTYTVDLAKATKELVESDKGYGVYHLVNEGPATWYQACRAFFAMAGINIKIKPVKSDKFPRPALRPKYSVLLNTKLPKLRDYREALAEYLKNF